MDGLFSDEELFLTQNSFSEERVEDNFSIDSILYGLVACDEPVSQNSCEEELKQVVTEKSIKDGRTDPSNYPEAVRKIVIVDDEELEKRKESRIPANTRINTSWAVRAWSEWALERNGMIAIKGETGITLPEVKHVFSLYIVCSEVHLQMTLLRGMPAGHDVSRFRSGIFFFIGVINVHINLCIKLCPPLVRIYCSGCLQQKRPNQNLFFRHISRERGPTHHFCVTSNHHLIYSLKLD